MHRQGPARESPLTGGEILKPAGGADMAALAGLGIDARTLPFGNNSMVNASVARSDYQQVNSQTAFSSTGPVVFDVPAVSSGGQMIDLKTSKLVCTFTISGLTQTATLGWQAGLCLFNQIRVFANGREIGIQSGSLAPFAALHRAMFARSYVEPDLRGREVYDVQLDCTEQQTTGFTSPWRQPRQVDNSAVITTQYGFNDQSYSYPSYQLLSATWGGPDTTCQVMIPLDLVLPMCDEGRFIDASRVNLRIECTPCNSTFSCSKTLDAFTLTPSTAQLWMRRVTLTDFGRKAFDAALGEAKLLSYPISLMPQTQSYVIPAASTSWVGTILASGSRPQMLVAHFVSPASLNMSGWTATNGTTPRAHLFQVDSAAALPTISACQARINGQQFPALYQINRASFQNGGSAPLDYEVYAESCKAVSETGSQDGALPFLPYSCFTDRNGLAVICINLTDSNQSTYDRTRDTTRANLELSLTFASAIPAGGMGLVLSLLSSETVAISAAGAVGTSW